MGNDPRKRRAPVVYPAAWFRFTRDTFVYFPPFLSPPRRKFTDHKLQEIMTKCWKVCFKLFIKARWKFFSRIFFPIAAFNRERTGIADYRKRYVEDTQNRTLATFWLEECD